MSSSCHPKGALSGPRAGRGADGTGNVLEVMGDRQGEGVGHQPLFTR